MSISAVVTEYYSGDKPKDKKPDASLLPSSLSHYLPVLDTDAVLFKYMTRKERLEKLRIMTNTLAYLVDLYGYEVNVLNRQTKKDTYSAYITKAQNYIDILQLYTQPTSNQEKTAIELLKPVAQDGKPVGYWFKDVGNKFAKGMEVTKNHLSWVNGKRLAWVWASLFIQSVLELMPADYFNAKQAKGAASAPGLYTGYASFILYYFRGSIEVYFLLKETFAEKDLNKEQRWERFKTLADQRKFALINDWIWATGNMLTFFILTTKAGLGPWGDLLNLVLFVMDLGVTIRAFVEQQAEFEKEMIAFQDKLDSLRKKVIEEQAAMLADAAMLESEREEKKRLVALYNAQIKELEEARLQCQTEWAQNKKNLTLDICYALGLLLAFSLLIAPTGPGLAVIALTGGILCYAFTVIYKSIKHYSELATTLESKRGIEKQLVEKTKELEALLAKPYINTHEVEYLRLEIALLSADSAHQKDVAVYKTMHFARAITLEILMPAVFFVGFVYFPLGIAIAALAAVVAIALISNVLIEKLCKKEKPAIQLSASDGLFAKKSEQKAGLYAGEEIPLVELHSKK